MLDLARLDQRPLLIATRVVTGVDAHEAGVARVGQVTQGVQTQVALFEGAEVDVGARGDLQVGVDVAQVPGKRFAVELVAEAGAGVDAGKGKLQLYIIFLFFFSVSKFDWSRK